MRSERAKCDVHLSLHPPLLWPADLCHDVRDELMVDHAELATRARMTQVMNLLNLAPDI